MNEPNSKEGLCMDLTDKVAIVTGAGQGIGRAIALRLAGAGATVVVAELGDGAPMPPTADCWHRGTTRLVRQLQKRLRRWDGSPSLLR